MAKNNNRLEKIENVIRFNEFKIDNHMDNLMLNVEQSNLTKREKKEMDNFICCFCLSLGGLAKEIFLNDFNGIKKDIYEYQYFKIQVLKKGNNFKFIILDNNDFNKQISFILNDLLNTMKISNNILKFLIKKECV